MLDNAQQWSKLLKQFVGAQRHQVAGVCLDDQSQPDDRLLDAEHGEGERGVFSLED